MVIGMELADQIQILAKYVSVQFAFYVFGK